MTFVIFEKSKITWINENRDVTQAVEEDKPPPYEKPPSYEEALQIN